jgi:threonine synthase
MNRLFCADCNTSFSLDEPIWRCPCGGLLDIEFAAEFPLKKIAGRAPGLWRYREAIPLRDDRNIVSLGEGFTPLTEAIVSGRSVFFKQDHLCPSGSFKDRGATMLVSKVKELGIAGMVEDSSGNAGCALAAYAARAGVECGIYVPEGASGAKLAQIRAYGAALHTVPGPRENAGAAALKAALTTYYASHSHNPFFFQGTKTVAYEICEQFGWRAPDVLITPVGNGSLLLGAYIGFTDLLKAGIIGRLPRLIGVQAGQCAPLYRAFGESGEKIPFASKGSTTAEGIAVANPVRAKQILEAVQRTGGEILATGEEEIAAAWREAGRIGFYIEPTSAAVIAGLKQCIRTFGRDEVIVEVLTGHGLKSGK